VTGGPETARRLGALLFRYRSYIPPLLLVILAAALWADRDGRPGPGLEGRFLGLGLVPIALGFLIRAAVVGTAPRGTSGRSTLEQVAESLNTTGLYSVIRHPLYLGNFFLWVGLAITTGVWWAPPAIALAFVLFYRPIVATEEAFLARAFGEEFTRWAAATPGYWPNLRRWRPSRLPFRVKIVLRQEYYGFFIVVLFVVVLEAVASITFGAGWRLDPPWLIALGAATLIAGLLRWLQRNTSFLDVEGR
jgi:protein-S-isoprenylcysteine O-methyltransferase Ste14